MTAISGMSTALAGVAGYSIKVGSSFEAGMSKVQAVSGASNEQLQRLSDKAKEMGATTKFSATEAADAMNYMAMAGWKTGDMLNGIEGIMNLAAASGRKPGNNKRYCHGCSYRVRIISLGFYAFCGRSGSSIL